MTRRLCGAIGLLVLASACGDAKPEVVAEVTKRNAFVRALSIRENHLDAWSLNSRENLSFEEGMSNPAFLDTSLPEAKWFEVVRAPETVPGNAIRWLNRNVHFRARGDSDMIFAIRGKINVNALFTRPRLELVVDGELTYSQLVDEDGSYSVRVTVPQATVTDWIDIYATFSSLHEPVRAPGEPWVARLEFVEWEPATAARTP
ncbi:MAG: hypothetical protein H0T42_17115 [Deltaproteobacteria bacterium]|nr:hypothetical protein [Deltaproteobacteria bacterium]